jgi:hypothetical protein
MMEETKYVVKTHAINDNNICILERSVAELTFVLSLNRQIAET